MAKFNGQVTLHQFKQAAAQVVVLQAGGDSEWREALAKARTWRRVSQVLPHRHPMLAIACGEEV